MPSRRRVFDYQELFQVAIRHEYYGARHVGELFRIAPTPTTSARIQALGLFFRPERNGFAVLYDTAQAWSARSPAGMETGPLSFDLVCTSPHFVSMTDMDLDTSPRETPFHISNRGTATGTSTVNDGGSQPSGTRGSPVPLRAELQAPHASDGRMVQPARPFGRIPVATIDVFLSNGESEGGARMPAADGPRRVLPVSYEVVFAARRTFWQYYIVPQAGSGALDNLTIDPGAFAGPIPGTLANGDPCHRFLSKRPIALARHSSVRWSLHGRRRERMTRDALLVERLPVPAVDQLGLLTADECEVLGVDRGVCSGMFVYV